MALRFNASGDRLSSTTNLPGAAAFTLMGWVYIAVDLNLFGSLLVYGDSVGPKFAYVGVDGTGTTLNLYDGINDNAGSALSLATWYHVALAGNLNGSLTAYLNGVSNVTATGDAANSSERIELMNNTANENIDGRLAAVKIYSAILTAPEILQEMRSFRPVRTANLNTWLPCVDRVVADNALDMSGNGYDMTVGGTLTVEDGPPIPWGQGRKKYFIPLAAGGYTPINAPISDSLWV